ncbi:Uncharacterised protein [Cedecea neteri]|uniref:Uncharacterized protein n=1 Tax=Cedecea neteri TaxID=158822 RepID=A0A2X3JDR3_9ENTR|nr:Uncharacterised protein [Cedecea neteri]
MINGEREVRNYRFTIKALGDSRQVDQHGVRTRLFFQFFTLSHK